MHHSLVQIRWNWKCLEIRQSSTTKRWKITYFPWKILPIKHILTVRGPSGPSGNLADSDDSLADDCDEPVPESGSISNAKPSLDQVNQRIQGRNDAQMQPLHNEVTTTVLHREGNISTVEQGSGCSQDISQISGPDGKSKLTPLSQIGFRDPASVGGGQQLTLLSIEVLVITSPSCYYFFCFSSAYYFLADVLSRKRDQSILFFSWTYENFMTSWRNSSLIISYTKGALDKNVGK